MRRLKRIGFCPVREPLLLKRHRSSSHKTKALCIELTRCRSGPYDTRSSGEQPRSGPPSTEGLAMQSWSETAALTVGGVRNDQGAPTRMPLPAEPLERSSSAPERHHIIQPRYSCDIDNCQTSCSRATDLSRHKAEMHGIASTRFICRECGYESLVRARMTTHSRNAHHREWYEVRNSASASNAGSA